MIRSILILVNFLLPVFLLATGPSPALVLTEVCDNALDDDQDGLIDLNDPDCDCSQQPIAPNGSFEDIYCCPEAPSQDFCIMNWQKGSLSTPDYINECGWLGWDEFPVPLPMPQGKSCIGFRNGRFESRIRPEEKEYIGICLKDRPLLAEITYHFRFFVGFTDAAHSPATNLAFFGASNCDALPAGVDNPNMVCPGDEPDWYEITKIAVNGTNTWLAYEFDYTPTETITALSIGPECAFASAHADLYYFFDQLEIEQKTPFSFKIVENGAPCSSEFSLEVSQSEELEYQWYRNKIALPEETSHLLFLKDREEGIYQVIVSSSSECILTQAYNFNPVYQNEEVKDVFCAGSSYLFNGTN